MALKRISVVVLICFLSFADAEDCTGDAEQAKKACGQEELCITINGKNATYYRYSKEMSITVECHYTGTAKKPYVEDFSIQWKKKRTNDIITETKCRNLKTEIRLSPHTNNVLYTCEKLDHSPFRLNTLNKEIKFIYVRDKPIPSSSQKPTQTPRSTPRPPIRTEYSATVKVTVNGATIGEVTSTSSPDRKNEVAGADFYYFNYEMVNVTCALVISGHNPKSYLLAALNDSRCIDGKYNSTQISHTQELTASMAAYNHSYQCSLKVGDKSEGETCVKIEKKALFTLHYKFAKLMMYINNEVKEEETTENGSEIVYTYNQEDTSIEVKCTHGDEVYNRRHISHPAIIWDTKQLDSTYKDNSKPHLKNPNTTIILFAGQSNSYLDCVENFGNQVSINKEHQPTRIRLRFIYAKLRMYIDNNNVTEEQKTTNGSHVVYKYKKENVTVVATCSHGAEVYRIPRYNMSHTQIIWITEKHDSTYKNNEENTTLIEENSIQIRLFADQNGSFVDCVDNSSITSTPNSKIRLMFIYEKDTENKSMSNPKDAEPEEKRDPKDAETIGMCDPKDAERAKVCGQKELCITIDNKIVSFYNYSKQTDISVECHYNGQGRQNQENFTIRWKNGGDVSNLKKCSNLKKVIHLSPDTNKTVYTCEKYSNAAFQFENKTEDITFLYVPEELKHNDTNKENQQAENRTLFGRLKSFFESHREACATGLVLFIAVIVAWVVLKSRKSPKEDKKRLNPKGSRESLEDIPTQHEETRSEPKLNEQYTDLNADTDSEVYSDPYSAMYTQPIPKSVRKTKVLPNLPVKPKPRNVENHFNSSGLVYEEPSTYNNINSNTRRIAENTGATYNNIDKSSKNIGATYNFIGKSSKNTGATYNNIGKSSKHTGATYNNIDKSLNNTQRVHIYDNMAASYSNAENEKFSSDVYSEPGLYEEPS